MSGTNPPDDHGFNPQGHNPYQSPHHVHQPRQQGDNLGDDAAIRMLLPVGRSGWAIAAGYAGLFSLLCLPGPLAVILGIVAIIDIQSNPHKHGMGRAIFGIVMGALGSILLVLALIGGVMG